MTGSAAAAELEAWEIYAFCSFLPSGMIESDGIKWDRDLLDSSSICERLTSLNPPQVPLSNLKLTEAEFNSAFQSIVGYNFINSVNRYELSDYVRKHSQCYDGNPRLDADIDLDKLSESYFFGLLSPDTEYILEKISVKSVDEQSDSFWSSLARILQVEGSHGEARQYSSFSFLIEYLMRDELLQNGEIFSAIRWGKNLQLWCSQKNVEIDGIDEIALRKALRASRKNYGNLKQATILYVEINKEKMVQKLKNEIRSRGKMEFFCGDLKSIFFEKLKQKGHWFLHDPEPWSISYFVDSTILPIECLKWRAQYFEDSVKYLDISFKRFDIKSPVYSYSSPFQ